MSTSEIMDEEQKVNVVQSEVVGEETEAADVSLKNNQSQFGDQHADSRGGSRSPKREESTQKNCKLHIGNLQTDIAEETLRKAFQKFGAIREVKVIRKNSQGQPLKDYCYGFVLMVESASAQRAVQEMKENPQNWTVAFSKDKVVEGEVSRKTTSPKKKEAKKDKKEKDKKSKDKKEKEKEKEKKEKEKEKEKEKARKEKAKKKSRSKSRSVRKKKTKRDRSSSSSSSSSSDFIPKHSVLVPVQQHGMGMENSDMMSMIFTQPDELQQMIKQQQTPALTPVVAPIYVRELFISGIPLNKQSADINKIMTFFGIVEKIDVFPKQHVLYAYIKYKRLESAVKALEQTHLIAQLLENPGQIKIYFSDPFRRNQIVGNADDSEKDEELLPILFIGYPSNPNYTIDEPLLRKLAEKYGGPIKNLEHRKSDPQLRTFVLIEFYKVADAKKAKKRFLRAKVQTLGDKKCDVAMLSDLPEALQPRNQPGHLPPHQRFPPPQQMNPAFRPNQPPFQQQPVFYPPQQMPQYRQQPFPQQPIPQQPIPQQPVTQQPPKQTTPQHIPPNLQQPYYYQPPPQQTPFPAPPVQHQQNQQPPIDSSLQSNIFPNQPYYPPYQPVPQTQSPQQTQILSYGQQQQYQRPPPQTQQTTDNRQTTPQSQPYYSYQQQPPVQQIPPQPQQQPYQQLQQSPQQMPQQLPPQSYPPPQQYMNYHHEESNKNEQHRPYQAVKNEDNVFWSGFMTRGKSNRLGVDARILSTPDKNKVHLPYQLVINYKAPISDAVQKALGPIASVLILTPSDETQFPSFDEYVKYLQSKDRAGVIQSIHQGVESVIYIVPPGTREAARIYNASDREMIAIYLPK